MAARRQLLRTRRARTSAVVLAALAVLAGAAVVGGLLSPSGTASDSVQAAPSPPATNPLDPLSADEIATVFQVIEASDKFPAGAFFPFVKLKDPAKIAVLAWSPGQSFTRQAFAHVYDPAANKAYEAVVDLKTEKLVSWIARPGVQPAIYLTEYETSEAIVRAYQPWRKAMKDRGIEPKDVYLDAWAPGDIQIPGVDPDARIMRSLSFFRGELPNVYDRPIEGVVVTVDMNKGKVVNFVDTGIRPVNTTVTGNADTPRTGLKPLVVKQPDGPSFQIDGRNVVWQNWHFRVDYTMREGLVLHQVGYEQDGVVRPIIYRLTLNEIYVPYAIPDLNWIWRAAKDVGDYNVAQYTEPLDKNVDVPENAVFIDEVVGSDTGSVDGPFELPHAAAIYERDGGPLWDRTDPTTFERDARLARELVVTATYAIGNYTYQTEYVFKMNGAIDVRVASTGTTLNRGVSTLSQGEQFGANVEQNIAAPSHQHFFNFRIDFDVDGVNNRVVEENTASAPSSFGNAFVAQHTVLGTEQFRDANPLTTRSWIVESTSKENRFGEPTAYALLPGETAVPYSSPSFVPLQSAPFAQHPFWVTRFNDAELYAAGDYINQAGPGGGLTAYTASPENVNGKDVVVWYTGGFTHHPEPEEYPVMTTERFGFALEPSGFFDRNPALDAPSQQ